MTVGAGGGQGLGEYFRDAGRFARLGVKEDKDPAGHSNESRLAAGLRCRYPSWGPTAYARSPPGLRQAVSSTSWGSVPNPVIIVGAGPTGLSLALLLARAGIRSVLCERNAAPQAHPAACILDTRTMEVFREIGVADAILGESQDIVERARITWVTTLAGRELGSCSVLPDDVDALLALSPVHATSFPQNRLEPMLWAEGRDEPLIKFLPGHECVGVDGERRRGRRHAEEGRTGLDDRRQLCGRLRGRIGARCGAASASRWMAACCRR